MKQFKAHVRFIFEGTVEVNAKDKNQVKEYIHNHFGCVLAGDNPHTTLSVEEIEDWEFNVHPKEKIITKITLR